MIFLTYQPAMPTMIQMPRLKRVPTGLWPSLIAATLIGLHTPVSAQFSATPLRVLEAQAGIPYGDVATAQAPEAPAAAAAAAAKSDDISIEEAMDAVLIPEASDDAGESEITAPADTDEEQ